MCLVKDDLRRLNAKINVEKIEIDDNIQIIYHHYYKQTMETKCHICNFYTMHVPLLALIKAQGFC